MKHRPPAYPHRPAALLAVALLMAGLLTACSDSNDPTGPQTFPDRALVLDGDTGRVECGGDTADWDFFSDLNEFTIAATVRFADPSADRLQIIAANTYTRLNGGFLFGLENRTGVGQRQLRLNVMDGSGEYKLTSISLGVAIADTMWHTVVAIVDSGLCTFYIDGALVQNATTWRGSSVAAAASRPLLLGDAYSEVAGGNFHLGGALDNVGVWDRPLLRDEMLTYAADPSGPMSGTSLVTGLVGLWRFDGLEDLGVGAPGRNDVRDSSPAGHHGDVTGGAVPVSRGSL